MEALTAAGEYLLEKYTDRILQRVISRQGVI